MLNNTWLLSEEEKKTVHSLVEKGKAEQDKNDKFAIIGLDDFYKLFNNNEIALIKKYLAIDPKALEYKLPFLGYTDTPSDIVAMPNQPYKHDGRSIPCQYLPKKAHEAYLKLNEAMHKDLGKKVGILYGYRSPARQIFIFFDILERKYDYDFDKTIRRVCFPAYSEHVCTQRQAMDLINEEGVCEGFDQTKEYQWLQANAEQFGFFESYPKDNELEMMYEPWHWHYEA